MSFIIIDSTFIEIALLIIMIGSMIMILELKELYKIAICFITFMVAVSGLYWILGSPYLSVFQLTIYGGTTGIILFASLSVFPREEDGGEE